MPGNRLGGETSPYLLQHADNPVHWQPWDDEALRMARERDLPILLSIGYSACHWCHVMAHESFEDAATAAVMNELFVNIKVDREERPDLDKVYQTAHQVLAQRPGGWPLTVFLAPDDLTPYFAGTYFPPDPRYGMPGFKDVLRRVHAAYIEQRDALRAQNASLRDVFTRLEAAAATQATLNARPIEQARRILETEFDAENGGFRGAPKFPHPANLQFLLNHSARNDDKPAERMALFTLRCMTGRGLYDHLAGGYFRYCVDAQWRIPHFEKMLYDNGPLLGLVADTYARTHDPMFRDAAIETADWALREMQSPEGGFYSTLDADAAGREGGFHVWTPEQVHHALASHPEGALLEILVKEHFGFDLEPNFEGEWHLNIHRDIASLAEEHELPEHTVREHLDTAKQLMFEAREAREHPGRDEKIIASWNGLMISGLARAARCLDRADYAEAATRALDFVREKLWRDGRLLAVYKDGRARFNAYLDDYANLLAAALELLQCRWRGDDLEFARALATALLEHFEDREHGGFFFTSHDHEALIHRPKPFADDATPSGNGVAAAAVIRLGHLLGEQDWLDAAERCLRAAWPSMQQAPHGHASMLEALHRWLHPDVTVILRGDENVTRDWQTLLASGVDADRVVLAIPAEARDLPEALALREPKGECVGYVCRAFSCSAPVVEKSKLLDALKESAPS